MSVRVKKNLEAVSTLKVLGATATEAKDATLYLQSVANNSEAAPDLRSEAVRVYQELQMRPEDTPRREALMAVANAIATKYVASA
jgi:hypothetical protein